MRLIKGESDKSATIGLQTVWGAVGVSDERWGFHRTHIGKQVRSRAAHNGERIIALIMDSCCGPTMFSLCFMFRVIYDRRVSLSLSPSSLLAVIGASYLICMIYCCFSTAFLTAYRCLDQSWSSTHVCVCVYAANSCKWYCGCLHFDCECNGCGCDCVCVCFCAPTPF